VVDTLFDQVISFQLADLKAVTKVLHEVGWRRWPKSQCRRPALLAEARALIAAMPVSEAGGLPRSRRRLLWRQGRQDPRQAEFEQKWAAASKDHYAKARAKADDALKLVK
jgi:phosphoglycerate transport regulatory protein PgtC